MNLNANSVINPGTANASIGNARHIRLPLTIFLLSNYFGGLAIALSNNAMASPPK